MARGARHGDIGTSVVYYGDDMEGEDSPKEWAEPARSLATPPPRLRRTAGRHSLLTAAIICNRPHHTKAMRKVAAHSRPRGSAACRMLMSASCQPVADAIPHHSDASQYHRYSKLSRGITDSCVSAS